MKHFEIQTRVRYSETDKMGYCYYGNYAAFFEMGRVEALRSIGVSYKKLEDDGIALPVSEFSIKYLKPAYYDDLLTIRTMVISLEGVRIDFEYETFNEKGDLLNKASTTLVFVDNETGRPMKVPKPTEEAIKAYLT